MIPTLREGLRADNRLGDRMTVYRLRAAFYASERKLMKSSQLILNQIGLLLPSQTTSPSAKAAVLKGH
jgi:hypothetical protein